MAVARGRQRTMMKYSNITAAGGRLRAVRAMAAQKLMWEALREAVDEEMEADPTVCLMGELCMACSIEVFSAVSLQGMQAMNLGSKLLCM